MQDFIVEYFCTVGTLFFFKETEHLFHHWESIRFKNNFQSTNGHCCLVHNLHIYIPWTGGGTLLLLKDTEGSNLWPLRYQL